ncbi:MAG: DUF2892 domain-containing protein [Candidatus Riflebacteria bacterium]|nr:DUF2892 domain-containing protein [Candidatus Riflebacteria bacterium]
MTIERIVRLVAGTMITLSVILTRVHHPAWALLTVFVGLNLFQSGLTKWCLLEDILAWAGFQSCCRESTLKESEVSVK